MNRLLVLLVIVGSIMVGSGHAQALYNHNSASYRNQTWMSLLGDGVPLRKMSIIGSHSSMSTGRWGDAFQTQGSSLTVQLQSGIRALDIRCNHKSNSFAVYESIGNLYTDLSDVLNTVQSFLNSYPLETIILHILDLGNPSSNSRSFEQTFIAYRDSYPNLFWIPTTQNPTLGMTRGKIVLLQHFPGAIHGMLYDSFTTIEHKKYSTNWDQHDRWVNIKNFMSASNAAGESRIAFWTGYFGSFPYFCASGKSSPQNGAPRLVTGLTTPGFSSSYPEFPRVACFIGICSIVFEGINILGYNHYMNSGLTYLGITFIDFGGDTFLSTFIGLNSQMFAPCSQSKIDAGCLACSNTAACISCNEDLNYVLNAATGNCDAAVGYYLNETFYPEPCEEAIAGCLECTAQDFCTLCDTYINYQLLNNTCEAADGYYLDANSIPVKCDIYGCYMCSSASTCTQCSAINNFIMDSPDCICDSSEFFSPHPSQDICICQPGKFLSVNGSISTCQPMPICPDEGSGCVTCGEGGCDECDAASGFTEDYPYCACEVGRFYDGAACPWCNETIDGCSQCLSELLCTSCIDNFTLLEGACVCQPQFYLHDSDTCLGCPIGCLHCNGLQACTLCDENSSFVLISGVCQCEKGMYLDGSQCLLCGNMAGCVDCDMDGCIQCNPLFGFWLNTSQCSCEYGKYVTEMDVCAQCRMEGCLDCIAEDICVECDNSSYYLTDDGICAEICGDGLQFSLECDDGNNINGDGCSANCKVEKDFTCSGGSSTTPSLCSFSGKVQFEKKSFLKSLSENKATIVFTLSPKIPLFSTINYDEAIVPNFPVSSKTASYDPATGQVTMQFSYDESLNTREDMEVTFQPPGTTDFFYTKAVSAPMPGTTDNNLALKVYEEEVYDMVPTIKILAFMLLFLALITFLFGMFASSKLMAVEMIEVIQLAYIGLIMIDKIQALVYPLINLWPINGYNNILPDSPSQPLPTRVSTPGYKALFLSNFSLNIVLVLLPFIIGLIFYARARKVEEEKEKEVKINHSYQIMKEWGISVLLFVQLHLTVSLILAFMYGVEQIFGIVLGILVSLGLIAYGVLLVARPDNFGEYKSFFVKDSRVKNNFYVIVIVLRVLLGILIPALNTSPACCYSSLAISVLLLALISIIRPYTHNIRPIFNSIIILLIMIVYTVYRTHIVDETEWMTTYLPIFLITILLVCVLVNLGFMIKHSICYRMKKEKEEKKREGEWSELKQVVREEIKKSLIGVDNGRRIFTPHREGHPDSPSNRLLKDIKKDITKQSKNSDDLQQFDSI